MNFILILMMLFAQQTQTQTQLAPTVEVPAVEVQQPVEVPVRTQPVEVPAVEVPVPTVDVPAVEVPLPTVKVPAVRTPAVAVPTQLPDGYLNANVGVTYNHPGLIVHEGGGVVGTDHLYNLAPAFNIRAEVIASNEAQINISEGVIENLIAEEFKKEYISTQAEVVDGFALPEFHMLVLISKIERGFVVFVEGRLFESVKLERVRLEAGTAFQAITWETQSLSVTPEEGAENDIRESVRAIAKLFVERYVYFEELKNRHERRGRDH